MMFFGIQTIFIKTDKKCLLGIPPEPFYENFIVTDININLGTAGEEAMLQPIQSRI